MWKMQNIIVLLKKLKVIIQYLCSNIKMSLYNEFTIENYFRRNGYSIGKNNRIFIHFFSSEPYLIKIGNHCTITSGVKFITHDGGSWIFREEMPDLNVFGKIEIKDNCFIGLNSIILPNVTIGPNSVVGAGAVVSKNVPPNTIVAGVPAKVIGSTEEYKKKCLIKWKSQNLNGPKEKWETQLIEHFWGKEN
ncbi:MAG: acyltransferase [Methanobacterium paludis]|nr:acyltransferase [Methanobacterium paludis]